MSFRLQALRQSLWQPSWLVFVALSWTTRSKTPCCPLAMLPTAASPPSSFCVWAFILGSPPGHDQVSASGLWGLLSYPGVDVCVAGSEIDASSACPVMIWCAGWAAVVRYPRARSSAVHNGCYNCRYRLGYAFVALLNATPGFE